MSVSRAAWQIITTLAASHSCVYYFMASVGQKAGYIGTGVSAQHLKRLSSRCWPGCVPPWRLWGRPFAHSDHQPDSALCSCGSEVFPCWLSGLFLFLEAACFPCHAGLSASGDLPTHRIPALVLHISIARENLVPFESLPAQVRPTPDNRHYCKVSSLGPEVQPQSSFAVPPGLGFG